MNNLSKWLFNHKTIPPSNRSEVLSIKNKDGVRFAQHDSFEYVYNVSKLSTKKYFFMLTILDILDKNPLSGVTVCFFGDLQKAENERTKLDKIKIVVK